MVHQGANTPNYQKIYWASRYFLGGGPVAFTLDVSLLLGSLSSSHCFPISRPPYDDEKIGDKVDTRYNIYKRPQPIIVI